MVRRPRRRLAEVRAGRGIGHTTLRLRDRDGRRLKVGWSRITEAPELVARVGKEVQVSPATGADVDALSTRMVLGRER